MTDTAVEQSTTSGSAPGAELSIPKHRFDEVSAKLRAAEEANALKDRLYMEDRQRWQVQQSQPRNQLPTAEDLGIDPQTYKAVATLAEKIADSRVAEKEAIFGQQIGILSSRTEKAELLASKGSDKAKYLPEVERRQKEYYQRTGGFLPAEMALDLIRGEEKDREIERLTAQLKGKTTDATTQAVQSSGPSAQGTREMPTSAATGSGGAAQKTFGELSVEEMEARLDEQLKRGAAI